MPCIKNPNLAERFTATILTANKKAAPYAKSVCPAPNINPRVAVGGNKATATITPTRILGMPEVNDNTAAAPDASAKTAESSPTYVRAKSSRLSTFKGH